MKKRISMILVMLMLVLMLSVPAFGNEEDTVMLIIKCPEQGFSTLCLPGCTYDYTPDGGVSIQLDDAAGGGSVSIFKTDAPGADFAAEAYFENAFIDLVVQSYGDRLLDLGEYTIYPFAGKELPGRMVLYNKDGQTWMRFCLFDLEDDYFVRYEAFSEFDEEKAQNAVDVMSDAIRYLQPDATYYAEPEPEAEPTPEPEAEPVAEAEPAAKDDQDQGVQVYYMKSSGEEAEVGVNVKIISCTAEGFSTKCGISDTVEYKDSLGVTAFLESDGPTIWVRVHRLDFDPDFDTEVYFRDEVDPSMQYIYKDNEYVEGEFTEFQTPYKYVVGKEYQYSIGGYDYTRRVMIYKNDSDIVRFEMAYTDDTLKQVQWDLDKVTTCYEPDPDCYQSSYSGRADSIQAVDVEKPQNDTPAPEPATKAESQKDTVDLQVIDCPQQGFSVMADDAYSWDYQDDSGITIYTNTEGSIPYVIVYQSEDLIMEPYEYIVEQYTPHMEQKYGADLIAEHEYEYFEVGGRQLPVGIYTYQLDGHDVKLIRVMDSTGPQTVIFTAKYEDGNGQATLDALDTAVKTFERY